MISPDWRVTCHRTRAASAARVRAALEQLRSAAELNSATGAVGVVDAKCVHVQTADGGDGAFSEPEVELADDSRVGSGGVGERACVQGDVDVVLIDLGARGHEAFGGERVNDCGDRVVAGEVGGLGCPCRPPSVAGAHSGADGAGEEAGEAPIGGGLRTWVAGRRRVIAIPGPAGVATGLDLLGHESGFDEAGEVEANGVGVHPEPPSEIGHTDRPGGSSDRVPHPPAGRFGEHLRSHFGLIRCGPGALSHGVGQWLMVPVTPPTSKVPRSPRLASANLWLTIVYTPG